MAKRYHEEMTAEGMDLYKALGKHVCAGCFEDEGLKAFVAANATENICDFCGGATKMPSAAPLVEVVRFMNECIGREFSNPADEMGWCGAEGGWLGAPVYDTWDLLKDEVELCAEEDLFRAIHDSLGIRDWCQRNPYGLTESEGLKYSWDSFCRIVKYERRYFFMRSYPADDGSERDEALEPADLLAEVARICMESGLVKTLARGERVVRVRLQARRERHVTAASLGPPPPEASTQSNRMNPPGVSIMYAAGDASTALAETVTKRGNYALGTFEFLRDALVLDLTEIPQLPSLFDADSDTYHRRHAILFLRKFVADASRPVEHDDRVHIDYVPTQIVAEYFRLPRSGSAMIDGIRYASSQYPTGTCYALFARPADVTDSLSPAAGTGPWLGLVARRERYSLQRRYPPTRPSREGRGRPTRARRS